MGYRPVLRPSDASEQAQGERACGACSLCCTVLRVDELAKPGGEPCVKLRRDGPGCSIHATRPSICRRYRCLWLQGGLEEDDRPDRIGAVLDLLTEAGQTYLAVREAVPGALDRSRRLQRIVGRFRSFLPVRICDNAQVMNPDAPFRLLLPDGEERRIAGDEVAVYRDGRLVERRRLPWLERRARRVVNSLRGWRWRRRVVAAQPPNDWR